MQTDSSKGDAADLRELRERLRRESAAGADGGTLHATLLLARLALRGMLEQGASEQEIADALGTTPERIRRLYEQWSDNAQPQAIWG